MVPFSGQLHCGGFVSGNVAGKGFSVLLMLFLAIAIREGYKVHKLIFGENF